MSQITKCIAAALLLSLSTHSLSYAQALYAGNRLKATNKTILPVSEKSDNAVKDDLINPEATASFAQLFPEATKAKWSNIDGNSFVSFSNNGQKATAGFNARGKINYVITSLNKEQLPAGFLEIMETDYANYHLYHAREVKAYGRTAYHIILENDKDFVTLKYAEEIVEEMQHTVK